MAEIERFEPSMDGKMAYEHWHRYAVCKEHARGLEVLDVACGEGYGSALLAEEATRVVGMDVDQSTVARAKARYKKRNRLSFERGDCRALPFTNGSFDLVVSMETLEHIAEQKQFLSEVKRVLRPHGVLIVSTPNRPVYSEEKNQKNPFHLAELDEGEFAALLSTFFKHAEILGHRLYISSIIGPMENGAAETNDASYLGYQPHRSRAAIESVQHGPIEVTHPEYMLAVCSDAPISWPTANHSVYIDSKDDLWRQQEKVLVWASQLHEEDELLRARVREAESSKISIETELEAARQNEATNNAFVARLAKENERLSDRGVKLQNAAQEMTAALETARSELERERNEGSRLKWDHGPELASELQDLSRAVSQELGTPGAPLEGPARLAAAVRLLHEVRRARDLLAERSVSSEKRERVLEQSLADLRAGMARVENETSYLREETRLARGEAASLATQTGVLQNERDASRIESAAKEASLSTMRDSLEAARRDTAALAQDAAQLRAELEQREADIGRLRAEIDDEGARRAALQGELGRRHAELEQTHRDFGRLRAELDSERSQASARDADFAQQAFDMERLRAEVEKASHLHAEQIAQEASLRQSLQQELGRRRRFEEQVERYGAEIHGLRKQTTHALNKIDPLRAELDAHKIELGFLRAELGYSTALASQPVDKAEARSDNSSNSVAQRWADARARRRRARLKDKPSRRFKEAVRKADALRDAKHLGAAAEGYKAALEIEPQSAPIWVQYGHMLKEGGDRAEAIKAYRRALDIEPEVADTQLQLGHALKLHGEPQAALEAYRQAFRLDPALEDVQPEMDSIAHHIERISLDPRQIDLLEAGNEARDQRDWRKAAELYGRLLRAAPRLASIWVQYGNALKEVGHPRAAARAYRKAIAIRPEAADPFLQLGHVLKRLDDVSGAQAAYRTALALAPASESAQAEVAALGAAEAEFGLPHLAQALDDPLDVEALAPPSTVHGLGDSDVAPEWPPQLFPEYWLPQRLRDLIIDRYGEPQIPLINYLMGLVNRFGERPDEFRASFDRAALLGRVRAKAAGGAQEKIHASIVIPVYNNFVYTLTCIASILEHETRFSYEIIVGDDRSSDGTEESISEIGGRVRLLRYETNLGFLQNCNASAASALGEVIVVLNNDTIVLPGWLDAMMQTFESHPKAGFVGSKLISGDGTLQEAGGIFWKDGSAWNFGRNGDSTLPEFNYTKEVDYCSGASIAVPRPLWDELGGFDPLFSPAYCEDSDLAFRVRRAGRQTLYQPYSALIHHEGASHGRDLNSGVKAYQVINQKKFFERWKDVLEKEHFPNSESVFVARDRTGRKPHILVIDHYIPQWDRDAGSRTLYLYIKLFRDRGFQVILWPDNLNEDRGYIRSFQDLGVEVIYSATYHNRFVDWFKSNSSWIGYAFVSRPHIAALYLEEIAKAKTKVIYYGHDLHFRRLLKEYEISKNEMLLKQAESDKRLEEKAWRCSDVILYPSADECAEVRASVSSEKAVVEFPITFFSDAFLQSTSDRLAFASGPRAHDMMFVGGFSHGPNVDGIIWFVREVMPILRSRDSRYTLRIAGSNPPGRVIQLAGPDVEVLGRISDLELHALYEGSGLAVLPLRFGAGIKGKLIEAFAFGTPVVSTTIGVQGVDGAGAIAYVADEPQSFADAIVQSSHEDAIKLMKAKKALEFIKRDYSEEAAIRVLSPHIMELRPKGS